MNLNTLSKSLIPDLPATDDVLPYLRRIDASRWYSNFGPLVCEFENRLRAQFISNDEHNNVNNTHLTTLASGYHALEIGLRIIGTKPGHRVLVPAITFTACPLAIQHAGFEPVLSDVDPVSWTLTPRIARAVVSKLDISAVMPVAVYGVPIPASEWDDFSRDTNIPVLIDAAAALDAQPLSDLGLTAFSLHATKPFGVGEGGVLVGRDPDVIAHARQYSNFGMIDRIVHVDGANAKMSEYHAAVGMAQMDRWEKIKRRRMQLLSAYHHYLAPLATVATLQPSIEKAVASCVMLLLKEPIADKVLKVASHSEIALHRTYLPPLYRHPNFARLTLVDTDGAILSANEDSTRRQAHMANSELLFARLIGLPFHVFLNEADIQAVVDALADWLSLARREAPLF